MCRSLIAIVLVLLCVVLIVNSSRNPSCGSLKSAVQPRILNRDDEPAVNGEFPWLVAIFNKTWSGNFEYRCGGSLIHPRVVLTAYHCLCKNKPSDLLVRANGKAELPTKEEDTRYISEIAKHPKYVHTPRLFNDAALLFLDTPFDFGDSLNTLCLPPPDSNSDLEGCVVAGWGKSINGQRTTKLKRVEVPFLSHTVCQDRLRKTKLGGKFVLHSSFMCAGGERGKDACIGDGGSPLMCEIPSDPSRYFQAGIVSWGIGCGDEGVPGVYTDTGKISGWIEDELRARNLSIKL